MLRTGHIEKTLNKSKLISIVVAEQVMSMRIDIVAEWVWIDINPLQIDLNGQPPQIRVPLTLAHMFGDRKSEFLLSLVELWYSKIRVGSRFLQLTLQPGTRQKKVVLDFTLWRELSQLIENEREKIRAEDLKFSLIIEGEVNYYSIPYESFMGSNSIRHVESLNLSLSEWKKALGLTEHQLIPLSNDVVSELEDLRRKWGFWKIEDVITKFLEFYKGEKVEISQQLLVTLYETKTIRDKIAELAQKSATFKEVRIISPYLDNTGVEHIMKMLKNKVDVKLITRKPDKKAHADALTVLKGMGASIKTDNMMHARLIIFDDVAAIISSADLDSEGLNNQRQIGILTTDKITIKDAIVFFDKVWELASEY